MRSYPVQTSAFVEAAPFPERITPDKWQPEEQVRPRWGLPVATALLAASTAVAYTPPPSFPERTSPDKYAPEIQRPRFDLARNQALYPFEFRGDVPRTETITPDKWHPPIEQAMLSARRGPGSDPGFVWAPTTPPAPSVAGWVAEISRPVFDLKRTQALYPALSYTEAAPFNERITADKWHPEIQRPRFDLIRRQDLAPFVAFDPQPFASPIFADKWHPEIQRPRFDLVRNQALYPAEFRGDVPRLETVSADRWHPEIQRPRFDWVRRQDLYPAASFTEQQFKESIYPDKWHPEIQRPRFDLIRRQDLAPSLSHVYYPPAPTLYPDKWHPEIQRPRFDLVRRQDLAPSQFFTQRFFAEAIKVDEWFQEAQRPVFNWRRQQSGFPVFYRPDILPPATPRTPRIYRLAASIRSWVLVASRRAYVVPASITGGSAPMISDVKDPASAEDFQFDWSRELGTDTISVSTWSASGVTVGISSFTGTTATVRLSGGKTGQVATVKNTVTLASGQVKSRYLQLTIAPQ